MPNVPNSSPFWRKIAEDIQAKYKPLGIPCIEWKKKDILIFLAHLEEVVENRCKSNKKLNQILGRSYSTGYHTFRKIFQVDEGWGNVRTRDLFAIYLGYNDYHQYLEENNMSKAEAFVDKIFSQQSELEEIPESEVSTTDKELDHPKEESPSFKLRLREHLKRRYTKRWNQKLAGREPLSLRILSSTKGSSENISKAFKVESGKEITDEILKIFKDAYERLLVVGEPGSGKSTLLLKLGLSILKNESNSLPIILDLATWNTDFLKLEDWLENILPAEFGKYRANTQKILKTFPLILLLDGFDEIRKEERKGCLVAIGAYASEKKHRFVITSRIKEYEEVSKDPIVYSQIEVGPLSIRQIESQLENADINEFREAPFLLIAIKADPVLRDAVKTTLYFNLLQLLFANGKLLNDLDFSSEDALERQVEIKEKYIEHVLQSVRNEHYDENSVKQWLSFLAHRMNQNNIVVFELVDLQYSWVKLSRLQKLISGLIYGLMIGTIYSLAVGTVLGFSIYILNGFFLTPFIVGFFTPLIAFTLFGGFLGLNRKYNPPKISSRDRISWSLTNTEVKSSFRKYIPISLVSCLILGPIAAHIMYPNLDPFIRLTIGVLAGLFGGIFWGGVLGMTLGTINTLHYENYTYLKINSPYQRFLASAKNLYFSFLQHFYLRYLLYKKDLLPFWLPDFLNVLTTNYFMESDDGETWRFRHKILQDHFAEIWEEEEGN